MDTNFEGRQTKINILKTRNYLAWQDGDKADQFYFAEVYRLAAEQDELNADMKRAAVANKGRSVRGG